MAFVTINQGAPHNYATCYVTQGNVCACAYYVTLEIQLTRNHVQLKLMQQM